MRRDETAEKLREHLEGFRPRVEKLRGALPEMGYGQRELSDDEHVVYMQQMQMQDPLRFLALPFVKGGRQELERYAKTRGGARRY